MGRALLLLVVLGLAGCRDGSGAAAPSGPAAPSGAAARSGSPATTSAGHDPVSAPDDHGDVPAAATPLALGQVLVGLLERPDDLDAFRVALQAGTTYAFQVHSVGSVSLALLGPDGAEVASHRGGMQPAFELRPAVSGDYTLRVGSLSGTLDYAVEVSERSSP